MNMKAAILLVFILFASATTTLVALNVSISTLYNFTQRETDSIDFLVEPQGDPVDNPTPPGPL